MNREQIALKFPKGTKARVKALGQPGESMTEIILRALDGLEGAPPTPVVVLDDIEPDAEAAGLPARVTALENRIAALEVSRSDLDQSRSKGPTPDERLVAIVRDNRPNGMPWAKVADMLNKEGLRTPKGMEWTGKRIRDYCRGKEILV